MGGGLYWFVFSPFGLERCDSSLFIFKFPFVEDKVSHVFNGILVYIFHECFNDGLWNLRLDNLLMVCSWMAPLTPVVIVMRGFVYLTQHYDV